MTFAKRVAQLTLALTALHGAAMAGDKGAMYLQASSNGAGIGYSYPVNDSWAVRAQYNYFKRSFTNNPGGNDLDVEVKLSNLPLLVDWFPMPANGFRVTGGVVINDNKIKVTGTTTMAGVDRATEGEIKASKSPSPYIGIGYASRPKDKAGWSFNCDAGIMFQDPEVKLSAPGASQAEINSKRATVEREVEKWKDLPVVGVGLTYTF